MKHYFTLLAAVILIVGLLSGCSKPETDTDEKSVELTISAAASLQDSLEEIKEAYEKEHTNITIHYNFGGSGALQQQILQGAPVDLFLSAAEDKFDALIEKGFIDQKQKINLLANELVLIVPKTNEKHIQSFEDVKLSEKIALGTPETVPAGQYGLETLNNMQLWEEVKSKVVYTKDVRQVLTYTETENVDAGIVYKTDALTSDKVEVVATANDDTHTPIIYPVGIVKDSKSVEAAEDFYDFLQSEEAMEVFVEYGFKQAN